MQSLDDSIQYITTGLSYQKIVPYRAKRACPRGINLEVTEVKIAIFTIPYWMR